MSTVQSVQHQEPDAEEGHRWRWQACVQKAPTGTRPVAVLTRSGRRGAERGRRHRGKRHRGRAREARQQRIQEWHEKTGASRRGDKGCRLR